MAGHLSASTANTLTKRREIAARRRVAQQELEAAQARLSAAELGSAKPKKVAFVEVAVDVEARAATEAEIDLTYHVSGASWRPLYDLMLDGERLNVSYLAEITQQTGEDWPEVALVLSTSRPGQSQTLPELSPWYVGRPQPPRAPASGVVMAASMAREAAPGDDGGAGRGGGRRAAPQARLCRLGPQAGTSGEDARRRAGRERVRSRAHL